MSINHYLEKLYQDMLLRSSSDHTQEVYGRAVRGFLTFSGKAPEALNEQDVRNYTLQLMKGKLSKSSINTYQAAIRFFFGVTLNRAMDYLQMPRLKEDNTLLEILSREKIARLLACCENPKHKSLFKIF